MKKIILLLIISIALINFTFAQRGVVGEKVNTQTTSTTQKKEESTKEQPIYPTKNELRVGFFDFFNSEFLLSYEHLFNNNTGVVVNGGMILKQTSSEDKIGGEGELQYRLYMRPNYRREPGFSFNGIYTGPYVFYRYLDKTTTSTRYNYDYNTGYQTVVTTVESANYSTIGAGVLVGMKFIIAHRISIDMNVGGGLKYTDIHPETSKVSSDIFSDGYTGVAPRAKLTFGLRF